MPWVTDAPAEIIRDHVRLTIQPFDAPPDPTAGMSVMDHIGSDGMLLFATDYPHWQFDGDEAVPPVSARRLRRRSWSTTRCDTYPRLHEPETAHER